MLRKNRYIIFKELDESGEQGYMITFYDTNDNDILINDYTKVSKLALVFNKAKNTVYSDIKSVIDDFSLYKCGYIKEKITDVSLEIDVRGTMMTFKIAIVYGESGFASLTIFCRYL